MWLIRPDSKAKKEESGELPAEEWLRVDEIKRGVRPGIDELVLLITPHTGAYVERKGCISLHTDVEFLNEFIAVVQGFPKIHQRVRGQLRLAEVRFGGASGDPGRNADRQLDRRPEENGAGIDARTGGRHGLLLRQKRLRQTRRRGRTRGQPADPVRSGHPERHGRHGPFQRHRLCGGRRHERQRRTDRADHGRRTVCRRNHRENRPRGTPRPHGRGASDGHVGKTHSRSSSSSPTPKIPLRATRAWN